MQLGGTPWHLWGQVVSKQITNTGLPLVQPLFTEQLVNVNYNRPETWTFMMGFSVQMLPGGTAPAGVTFAMDLSLGIGRGNMQIPDFYRQVISNADLISYQPNVRWVTRAQSFDSNTGRGPSGIQPNFCEFIPAQTIQVRALDRGLLFNGTIAVTAFAFFAPMHHHRPEWHTATKGHPDPKFAGELGGY